MKRPQVKLNATESCGCGRRKEPAMQWCEVCFALLSPVSQGNYRRRAIEFQTYLGRLEDLIEKARAPNPDVAKVALTSLK